MRTAGQTVTELWARGFSALPYPQSVSTVCGALYFESSFDIAIGDGLQRDDPAVGSLMQGLASFKLRISNNAPRLACTLEITPGTVATEMPAGISKQGYRLTITSDAIRVTGNAVPGLYYGVQTLLQLMRPARGGVELPIMTLDDWPGRELRVLHYDTKHHQETFEAVKSFIERAAAFKINAVAWEIEDKFAYAKHPLIGAPGAFSAGQLKELSAFALSRHVELIPIVQGPSHLAFVLKHERYAHLCEDRKNNYMACPSKDETYQLLFSMYDELIDATPGCRYFHIGTDEPYFLGDGIECGCRKKRDEIGQGGMMADFIARCAAHLKSRGREPLCWGEHPLRPLDVKRLPPGLINAVYQNPAMSEAYRAQGIRELLYCPTQGAPALS